MAALGRFRIVIISAAILAASVLAAPRAIAEGTSASIFVLRHIVYPGDVITEESLVERKLANGAKPAFGGTIADIAGKVARRTLVPGQPIPASALRQQEEVVQGRSYSIVYQSGALTISGEAIPMKSGAIGEMVPVRNQETGVVVQALVQAGGKLLVQSR